MTLLYLLEPAQLKRISGEKNSLYIFSYFQDIKKLPFEQNKYKMK